MNTSHFPSLDRCKKLDKIIFPTTEEFVTETIEGVNHHYVRPSLAELLDWIPIGIWHNKNNFFPLQISRPQPDLYDVRYGSMEDYRSRLVSIEGTLPNALSDLILWLHKEGHLTFKK